MSVRIGVIDYGMGNRHSVQKALERTGASVAVSCDPDELRRCHGLVLPGVGAFPRAMRNLRALSLDQLIRSQLADGVPLLGICLGMQLLFEASEEVESTRGLGLLPGNVTRLEAGALRVPHIGWNEVRWERASRLSAGLPTPSCAFYHVHSFAVRPERGPAVAGTTEYGERFATVVEHDLVSGVQFHPEKSSRHGLALLGNFVRRCAGDGAAMGQDPAAALSARG